MNSGALRGSLARNVLADMSIRFPWRHPLDHGFATRETGKARNVRVAVTGASGNVGTSLLESLGREPVIDSVLGLARRAPTIDLPKVQWASAAVTAADLAPLLDGADALVHLAWTIQPARRPDLLHAVNVVGTRRVLAAALGARVPRVVYASSVGAYSP